MQRSPIAPLAAAAAVLLTLILACGSGTDGGAPADGAKSADRAYWPERSEEELDTLLGQTCETAKTSDTAVLLTFSAAWCGDCGRVRQLEGQPPLADELTRWNKVVVNVGRFHRHRRLIKAFDVEAIAYWVALQPGDCAAPVETWPVLRKGLFEPASSGAGGRSAADLAAWLVQARGG